MTTQVVFKIDPKIKARAMRRAKKEGVPFASVLKMMTQAFAEGEYSVKIVKEERFNEKTARDMRSVFKDIESGRNLSPAFPSGAEMDSYLDGLLRKKSARDISTNKSGK
ncbi:MAG: hypothetical protein Q8P16_00925 [bacterium]|nr:hypothetical protein [bacterium]